MLRVTGADFLTNPGGKPAGEIVTPGASARLPIGLLVPLPRRHAAPNLRFGPDANWRTKPILQPTFLKWPSSIGKIGAGTLSIRDFLPIRVLLRGNPMGDCQSVTCVSILTVL